MEKLKFILILFLGIVFFLLGTPVYAVESSGRESGINNTTPIVIGGAAIVLVALVLLTKKKGGTPKNTFMPADNNAVEDEIISRGIERSNSNSVELLDNNYDSVIQKFLPNYTEEKLLKELYEQFVRIQEAWMNFDSTILKKNCSLKLYSSMDEELKSLQENNEKNVMKDFELISSSIRNIEKKDNKIYIEMYLFVSYLDYVVQSGTETILRGNSDAPVRNPYDLEFVLDCEEPTNCPSCGALVENGECSACHMLVSDEEDVFLLNKKGIMRS